MVNWKGERLLCCADKIGNFKKFFYGVTLCTDSPLHLSPSPSQLPAFISNFFLIRLFCDKFENLRNIFIHLLTFQ